MTHTTIIATYKRRMQKNKTALKSFITRLQKKLTPKQSREIIALSDTVWQEIACLDCANCCKVMTPTYTKKDIKRIAQYFKMTELQFKTTYLTYDKKSKEWMNNTTPCKFLNLENNYCTIYDIRPDDCRKFPHHHKSPLKDYMHVHHQNIAYCPATYLWMEKVKNHN